MPHYTFICGEEGPAAPLPGGRCPPTAPPVGGGYLPPGRGAAGPSQMNVQCGIRCGFRYFG